MPTDENTQNLQTSVQIATARTVFTVSNISGIWVNWSEVINSSNMGIEASTLLSAYWRRRCPPQLSYHPRCPHPRNNRNHPSCATTSHTDRQSDTCCCCCCCCCGWASYIMSASSATKFIASFATTAQLLSSLPRWKTVHMVATKPDISHLKTL